MVKIYLGIMTLGALSVGLWSLSNNSFLAQNFTAQISAPSQIVTPSQTITPNQTSDIQTVIKQLQDQLQDLRNQTIDLRVQLKVAQSTPKFPRELKKGLAGTDVKQVQGFLKLFPEVYPEGLVSGYFGPLTENAIKRFQKIYNLDLSGTLGPKTRAKLISAIRKEIELRETKSLKLALNSPLTTYNSTPTSSTKDNLAPEATIEDLTALVDIGTSDIAADTIDEIDLYPFTPPAETTLPAPPPSTSTTTPTVSTSTAPTAPTTSTTPTISLTISNIQVTNIDNDAATIKWTTNLQANSEVDYSKTSPVSASTAIKKTDAKYVTSHELKIDHLAHDTTYYFLIISATNQKQTSTSSQQSFKTKK